LRIREEWTAPAMIGIPERNLVILEYSQTGNRMIKDVLVPVSNPPVFKFLENR